MKNTIFALLILSLISCGDLPENKPKTVEIGEVLTTPMLEVTVNEAYLSDEVNTGNRFSYRKASEGTQFFILNLTIKNTDNESRVIPNGDIIITDEKQVVYDKTELIAEDGWAIIFEQLNPGVSITTNVVYTIPTTAKGSAYYKPGRSAEGQLVFLGNL